MSPSKRYPRFVRATLGSSSLFIRSVTAGILFGAILLLILLLLDGQQMDDLWIAVLAAVFFSVGVVTLGLLSKTRGGPGH
ncbi:MAG TPA: hypothetical protein VFJ14_07685 [Nocardioidaceae bacterium]|nr:hypothetical protein [Nocardioidaceae bacterium]